MFYSHILLQEYSFFSTVAYNLENEDECVVALLHDIVEDTSVTFEDLENEGFSNVIIDTLYSIYYSFGKRRFYMRLSLWPS